MATPIGTGWSTLRRVLDIIQASFPNGAEPAAVTEGFYILDYRLLTMTSPSGVPVRDAKTGEKITHKLHGSEHPKTVALRLTLQIFSSRRDASDDFNRHLSYGLPGIY